MKKALLGALVLLLILSTLVSRTEAFAGTYQGVGFDYINSTSGHGAPVNGDIVSASVSNSTIRVYKNHLLILTGVNTEWSSGSPGVGFYGDTFPNVGFSSFTATDGIEPPVSLLSPLVTNGQFSFSFQTVTSQSYTVQEETNLAGPGWVEVTNFLGRGLPWQFSTPATSTQSPVFFRVREP